jgi:hypothetical protein
VFYKANAEHGGGITMRVLVQLPAGFCLAIGACVAAALLFPGATARVVLVATAVAVFAAWSGRYVAALATAAMSWCFATGFLVYPEGELAFTHDDLVRLAGFGAVAVAGCAFGRVREGIAGLTAQWDPSHGDLAVADTPAPVDPRERVAVGDAAAGAVRHDADRLGQGAHLVGAGLGEDDVRDVVADGVGLAHRGRRLPERRQPLYRSSAQVADVVEDVVGEQLVHPVQFTGVGQVPVQGDQIGDGRMVRG